MPAGIGVATAAQQATQYPAWQESGIYTGGAIVRYNGTLYEAKWWTQGFAPNKPVAHVWDTPWKLADVPAGNGGNSNAGSGGSTPVSPSQPSLPIPPAGDNDTGHFPGWHATQVYTGGEIVKYRGALYKAKWWTQGNPPGTLQNGGPSPWEPTDGKNPVPPANNGGNSASTGGQTPDNGGNNGNTGTGISVPTAPSRPVPTRAEAEAHERELTSSPRFQAVKQSIRTLPNHLVEKIEPGAKNNPANVKRVEQIISGERFGGMFPRRAPEYTYEYFLKAIGKFPAFCGTYTDGRDSDAICRKSLATMFSHFAQETGGHNVHDSVPEWQQALVYVREMGCSEDAGGGCDYNAECNPATWQGKAYPCGTNGDGSYKKYFGRGAKQLSYNYNYGEFSRTMTGDVRTLLDHPEQVADTWYNLASAVFFFVYPQSPKPSMLHVIDGTWQPNASDIKDGRVPGFGATTMIINGGVECGGSVEVAQSVNRMKYYRKFAKALHVPVGSNEKLGCAGMKTFDERSSAKMDVYWENDWASTGPYACRTVGYQTPYNALNPGDYIRCVEGIFNVKIAG